MIPTTAEIHELMQRMQTEKIIILDNKESFIISPTFMPIFTQYMQREQSPKSLLLAIISYCPDTTPTELSIYCGTLMEIIKITNASLYHEICATLDRDYPIKKYMKQKSISNIFRDIESEKSTDHA